MLSDSPSVEKSSEQDNLLHLYSNIQVNVNYCTRKFKRDTVQDKIDSLLIKLFQSPLLMLATTYNDIQRAPRKYLIMINKIVDDNETGSHIVLLLLWLLNRSTETSGVLNIFSYAVIISRREISRDVGDIESGGW